MYVNQVKITFTGKR